MSNPQAWRSYIKLVDNGKIVANPALSRYAARFRIAMAFESANFSGVADKSAIGYSIGLKVGLSYSALEALEKAIDKNERSTKILNPIVALHMRKYGLKTLFPKLMSDLTGPRLKSNIEKFFLNENDNLRYVAEGVRHLMFHGDYTAHGSGLAYSKSLQKTLLSLANLVLAESELKFSNWLDDSFKE